MKGSMDRNNDDPATLGLGPQLSDDLIHGAPSDGRIGNASGPWTHGKYVHVIEGLASSSGITVSAPRTTFPHVCPSPSLFICTALDLKSWTAKKIPRNYLITYFVTKGEPQRS